MVTALRQACLTGNWIGAVWLAVLVLAWVNAHAQSPAASPVWIATGYAPQHNYNVAFPHNIIPPPPPLTIADQTVRQIVRVSHGGRGLRVKVSNLFGATPLRLEQMQVALSAGEDAIVPASRRALYFAGPQTVVVAPGQERWSDAVPVWVPAHAHLAVSAYLIRLTPLVTSHAIGLHTNYLAPGNQVASYGLHAATTTRSYFWLSAVAVGSARACAAFVRATPGSGGLWRFHHRWGQLHGRHRSALARPS